MITINQPKEKKLSRKEYIKYLNDLGPSLPDDNFIIAGIMRKNKNKYGQYLHDYDKIAFEVSYNDWKREKQGHL